MSISHNAAFGSKIQATQIEKRIEKIEDSKEAWRSDQWLAFNETVSLERKAIEVQIMHRYALEAIEDRLELIAEILLEKLK